MWQIFQWQTFLCILMTNVFAYLWQFVVCAVLHGSCIFIRVCGTHMCGMVHSPVNHSYVCVTPICVTLSYLWHAPFIRPIPMSYTHVCVTLICVTWSYLWHTSFIRPIYMFYRAKWPGNTDFLARCIHIRDTTLSFVAQGYILKIQQWARTLKKIGVERYGITHPFV